MTKSQEPARIIAIGASAGGIAALYSFFDRTPLDQVSYVVIQHLSADHQSRLAELLRSHSQLQIRIAEANMPVISNQVYVIPSRAYLTIQAGRFQLTKKSSQARPHLTIDTFFLSLAADQGAKAIGIILSGTGKDGSQGIQAIRHAGGWVMVQDPLTAQYDQMPRSAIATGGANMVLSPEAMPAAIQAYVKQNPLIPPGLAPLAKSSPAQSERDQVNDSNLRDQEADPAELRSEAEESTLLAILDYIKAELPVDFSDYKRPTVFRRIRRRMALQQITEAEAYLHYLKKDSLELKALAKDFLISVTAFFRDARTFDIIDKTIIPLVVEKGSDPVKIWVAGCATGEEAYSLAMLVHEYLDRIQQPREVKIFATDLDQAALQVASKGIYAASTLQKVSPERLKRFFTPLGESFQVNKNIRRMLVFAHHDLVKNPPYCHMDLISCRNLLIYLNPSLQKKVFSLLHFGLRPGGYLLLGSSEQAPVQGLSLLEIDRKARLYQKTAPGSTSQMEPFVLPVMGERLSFASYRSLLPSGELNSVAEPVPAPAAFLPGNYLSEAVILTLLTYQHQVGVCLDENRRVVQAFGDLSPYLLAKGFNFNFNLMELLPQSLLVAFGTAFNQVQQTQEPVMIGGIRNDLAPAQAIHLRLQLFIVPRTGQKLMLLLLRPEMASIPEDLPAQRFDADQHTRDYLTFLEAELQVSKERLLGAAEELAAYRENMQSYNEELLSAGEEMQSGNEELQSINEELQTINVEYQLKIQELSELNDDLNNYFRSNVSGQLFVDKDLLVRKFSPAAVQHINLRESDIGRPLGHLTTHVPFETLLADLKRVILHRESITQELQATTGRWFEVTAMPYVRQADNRLDGAMVTFYDITELVLARQKTEEHAAAVFAALEAMPQIACTIFPDGRVDYFNQYWYDYSGMSEEQTNEQGWQPAIHPLDINKLILLWQHSLTTGELFEDEFRIQRGRDGHYRWHLTRAVPLRNTQGEIVKWVSTATDVDDQRVLLEEITEAKSQLLLTNEELHRTNVDLDTFVYTASHDLRAPIVSLRELLRLLTKDIKDQTEGKNQPLLTMMEQSVLQLAQVITDLAQIAQVQKETDLEKEAVDLRKMLQDVLLGLTELIGEARVSIEQHWEVEHLLYPKKNMRSILYNLVSNALKYRSAERLPLVKITCTESSEGPLLVVADNGLGLSPTQLPKLFTAFKRFHSHVEGTGIGLYMIKRMVENNGGRLEVESQEGVGTTFKVYFGPKSSMRPSPETS